MIIMLVILITAEYKLYLLNYMVVNYIVQNLHYYSFIHLILLLSNINKLLS